MSTIEERVAALESALASMTAAEKRIVELPAASSVANDDFVALDGVANGSRRFAASNLGGKAEVMTEAEWDDLPDSKLTDGKVYALSGVSPSTQDNPLWQKLGFASLDTQADDCSDAINELNTGLTTLNSNLTQLTTETMSKCLSKTADLTIGSQNNVLYLGNRTAQVTIVFTLSASKAQGSELFELPIAMITSGVFLIRNDTGTTHLIGNIFGSQKVITAISSLPSGNYRGSFTYITV